MTRQPDGPGRDRPDARDGGTQGGLVDRPRDRAGAAHAIEIAGDDEPAARVDEHDMIATETRRRQDLEPDVPGIEHVEIAQLAGHVWQRRTATGTDEHGDPEDLGDGLGARGVVRVDMGQGDRLDGAGAGVRQGQRAIERRARGIARIDEHEPTPADEIGRNRLARDTAAGGHDDPGDAVGGLGDLDLAERSRRQPVADLLDRTGVLELLEGRARRQPHGEPTGGHRRQRVRRAQPRVGRHLVALERRLRAGWQGRGEEPRVEPARHRRRRHPARQRDEPVGPQPQVEVVGQLGQGRLATHERRARRPDPRVASRLGPAVVGQQHARLLEQLADRGDVSGDAPVPARGRRRAPRRPRPARWPTARRARLRCRPDPPVRRGRRGRPARTPSSPVGGSGAPRARPRPSRSSTTVAAGRGSTGPFVTRPQPSAIAAASSSRSAAGSVTGRRHAKPRQT